MLDGLRMALLRRLDKLMGKLGSEMPPSVVPSKGSAELLSDGKLCLEQGQLVQARIVLRRVAVSGTPESAEAYSLLGQISEQQADWEDALRQYRSALELMPHAIAACHSAMRVMRQLGEDRAIPSFLETLVSQCPNHKDYRLLLAHQCDIYSNFELAVVHLSAAVELGADDATTYLKLGASLCQTGRAEQAHPYFERALAQNPSVAGEVAYHSAHYHLQHGDIAQGIALLEQAIAHNPTAVTAHAVLLATLSHNPQAVAQRRYQDAAQRFGRAFATFAPVQPPPVRLPGAGMQRPLRVGFLSGEFRIHPVFFFLAGVLRQRDKLRIHTIALSNNAYNDSATEELRPLFDVWHDIQALPDADAADLIRRQDLDVLIDLSGHSGEYRLGVLAMKPAPVQVEWLGYWASTGLGTMDYILADPHCVPKSGTEWFSEQVFYLPYTRFCMEIPQPKRPINVAPPPCIAKGFITFGSYQQMVKIRTDVLRVWAKVLAMVPNSRLRLQARALGESRERDALTKALIESGIDTGRVDMHGLMGWEDYLESHSEVDILLDTFPYTGATTTAFGLWMGVPTLTLRGDTMLGLQGVGMLSCVGLTHWIANTEEDYVALAVRHASDPHALAQLRNRLRHTAEQSHLFDTKRFALDLTEALWAMCREKAQRQTGALAASPPPAQILQKQGNALLAEGKLQEAQACFQQGLELAPNDGALLVCLGYVQKEQGNWQGAQTSLRRASQTANGSAAMEAHYLLGLIADAQNNWEDAIAQYRAALALQPDFLQAAQDVVRLLPQVGRESTIPAFLEECIRHCPNQKDFRLLIARHYIDHFQLEQGATHLKAAVALGVDDVQIYIALGSALCRTMREAEALTYFERAVALDASIAHEPYFHRGYYHLLYGDALRGVELLEESIAIQPLYLAPNSMLLMYLSHNAQAMQRSYQAVAKRFGQAFATLAPVIQPHLSLPIKEQERPLRVGFVAGEFRNHPIYYFLVDVLRQFDKSRIHTTAFSCTPIPDSATLEFKAVFDDWHDIGLLSDVEASERIRTQQLDVLIDLNGHSGETRLGVFALKPAPLQITWLGYWASTGLPTMDYIVADRYGVPENGSEWFSEKVFYMPTTRLCMGSPKVQPPVGISPAPCDAKGFITFGSYQQIVKITPHVLAVWTKVLMAVPNSRLRLQTTALHGQMERDKLTAALIQAGIDLARVEMHGSTNFEHYLASHSEVDILLDTFPYTGATTTAFGLWMGTPTITLRGNTMLSLQGVSMLSCVGLTDWIANSEDDYVTLAVRHASNPQALSDLRGRLRGMAEKSPLFDTTRFAKDFEDALWTMAREKAAEQNEHEVTTA